jgi:hypothetical protein
LCGNAIAAQFFIANHLWNEKKHYLCNPIGYFMETPETLADKNTCLCSLQNLKIGEAKWAINCKITAFHTIND